MPDMEALREELFELREEYRTLRRRTSPDDPGQDEKLEAKNEEIRQTGVQLVEARVQKALEERDIEQVLDMLDTLQEGIHRLWSEYQDGQLTMDETTGLVNKRAMFSEEEYNRLMGEFQRIQTLVWRIRQVFRQTEVPHEPQRALDKSWESVEQAWDLLEDMGPPQNMKERLFPSRQVRNAQHQLRRLFQGMLPGVERKLRQALVEFPEVQDYIREENLQPAATSWRYTEYMDERENPERQQTQEQPAAPKSRTR